MSLIFILLFCIAGLLTRIQCNESNECCYVYGSVPYNNSNCVPEGRQLALNYHIYNPRDNFTDWSVIWLRSASEDLLSYEVVSTAAGYSSIMAQSSISSMGNCSHELYRDGFSLVIHNFTQDKNGYYWYQLAINNTNAQRSRHARFYAGDCNHTMYFRLARQDEAQCAEYMNTPTRSSLTPSSSTLIPSVTHQEQESEGPIIYVAGSLGALVLVFGVLVLALTTLYLCKFRNRETTSSKSQQRDAISDNKNQGEETIGFSNEAQVTIQSATGQSLSIDTQKPQHLTALQLYDEVSQDKYNQQYREDQSSSLRNDEDCSYYEEVKFEAKEKQSNVMESAMNEKACHRENIKQPAAASELFDDIMYSLYPSQDAVTRGVTQHSNMMNTKATKMQDPDSDRGNVAFHTERVKFTRKQDENDYAEPVATKKQKQLARHNDEHLLDSADQKSNSQLKMQSIPTISSRENDRLSPNREANGTKHIYHVLQSSVKTQGRVVNYKSHDIMHLSTTVQDSEGSPNCDPTLYNCQFDDPTYESNPQPLANLQSITTPNSTKTTVDTDEAEAQENEPAISLGNPELLLHYDGDNETQVDVPQYSDPTDLGSVGITTDVPEKQEKGDTNTASIYDIFDDPTYSVGQVGFKSQ